MSKPKSAQSTKQELMHFSVGAIIKKDNKFLLIDRAIKPFGFASIAGHVDQGETTLQSLHRELQEESGLKITKETLIFEEELDWNWCSKNANTHYWYVFECEVTGEVIHNKEEAKSIGWYTKEQIQNLKLEPVWEYWFKKLKVVQ